MTLHNFGPSRSGAAFGAYQSTGVEPLEKRGGFAGAEQPRWPPAVHSALILGWKGKRRARGTKTETRHADNFLPLPLKASGMNLLSALKALKLI